MTAKLPLFVLVGPTGVGKTAISVEVAKAVGGEIISGDSMQVYRGMDIGTAKVTPPEMQGVPHHLIDMKLPDQPFTVAEFQTRVDSTIREIVGRGRLPMLVGGTGLYVRAVMQEYSFPEQEVDQELRESLTREATEFGAAHLHAQLATVDLAAAARLHPNDARRIIRALEVYQTTGIPISETQHAAASEARYDDLFLGLTMERELLYHRIDQRVSLMLQAGWVEEVRALLARYRPDLYPMEAIGYREIVLYLRGLLTHGEMVTLVKRNTRRFAKRQFTWFNREERLRWIDVTEPSEWRRVVEDIVTLVEGKWPGTRERKA